jgi:anti-anti-sigma factor
MQITVESAAPAIGTIVTLQGKLDVISTADVEKSLLDVIALGEMKLVIDCAALDFISSAGLRLRTGTIEPHRRRSSHASVFRVAFTRSIAAFNCSKRC